MTKLLPGTEVSTSYGTPAIKVGKRLMLRMHDKEDAIVLLINTVEEQQELILEDPMSFYITDHYKGYPAVLIRPTVEERKFKDLLELAWRRIARKSDLVEYDSRV